MVLCYISILIMFLTYILGSKISFEYACDAVQMWVWLVVSGEICLYSCYVLMKCHKTSLLYTYLCILCIRKILYELVLTELRYSCSRNCILWVCPNGRSDFSVNNACYNQNAVIINKIISNVIIWYPANIYPCYCFLFLATWS